MATNQQLEDTIYAIHKSIEENVLSVSVSRFNEDLIDMMEDDDLLPALLSGDQRNIVIEIIRKRGMH